MTPTRRTTVRRGLLTDKQVDSTKPRDKDYKVSDGNSMFVLVKASGAKLWRFKYYFAGKEKLMALGQYPRSVWHSLGKSGTMHGKASKRAGPHARA